MAGTKPLNPKKTNMKLKCTIATTAILLLCQGTAPAQGMIWFSTRVSYTVVGHVYGPGDGTPKTGNTASETPAGTQTYTGALLMGSGFSAQLFGGPLGTLEPNLVAIGDPSAFRTSAVLGGTPVPQLLSVPGVPAGSSGTFQVKAWDNAGGAISSWDRALIRGKSDLFTVSDLGDGVLDFPANLDNFRSFNLVLDSHIVPEPKTFALLGIGGLVLLISNRKKPKPVT